MRRDTDRVDTDRVDTDRVTKQISLGGNDHLNSGNNH